MNFSEKFSKNNLLKLLTNNFGLKVLSLAFAIVLYLIVRTEQIKEYTKIARVQIVTNSRLMVVGAPERAVFVTVRLPNTLFFREPEDKELVAELDFKAETKPGKVRVRLSQENFKNLDKRYVLLIHDPWQEIVLDNILVKNVSINVPIEGKPKDGYFIDKIKVTPEQIQIKGARRELINIQELNTSPINIDNIDKSFSSRSKILIEDTPSIKIDSLEEWVNVQVVVMKEKETKVFSKVPITAINGKFIDYRPKYVELEIESAKDIINSFDKNSTKVFVDLKNLPSGWHESELKIQIPSDTTLVNVTPRIISVKVAN